MQAALASWAPALSVGGVALEVIGLLITGVGAWKTWHEFATPADGGIFDPPINALRNAAKAVVLRTRRMLGMKPDTVVGAGVSIAAASVMNARAYVSYPPLGVVTDTTAAVWELDRRLRWAIDTMNVNRGASLDEIEAVRTELVELASRVETAVGALEAQTRRVAVGGIRLQFVGLPLVGLGLVLQGAGSALGAG